MSAKRKRGNAASQHLRLIKAQLDDLVEEALVDAYGESEQATAFYTMMENDLQLPFETQILGMTVTVQSIDITQDDQLAAVCRKDKTKQRISLSELPLPSSPPKGSKWIVAYRYWRTGKFDEYEDAKTRAGSLRPTGHRATQGCAGGDRSRRAEQRGRDVLRPG